MERSPSLLTSVHLLSCCPGVGESWNMRWLNLARKGTHSPQNRCGLSHGVSGSKGWTSAFLTPAISGRKNSWNYVPFAIDLNMMVYRHGALPYVEWKPPRTITFIQLHIINLGRFLYIQGRKKNQQKNQSVVKLLW